LSPINSKNCMPATTTTPVSVCMPSLKRQLTAKEGMGPGDRKPCYAPISDVMLADWRGPVRRYHLLRLVTVSIAFTLCLALGAGLVQAAEFDCERVEGAERRAAILQARRVFATKWLEAGKDWFIAFTLPGEPRNPFALPGIQSGSVAVSGYVWSRGVHCTYAEDIAAGQMIVRFMAAAYRFKEGNTDWTRPQRMGQLMRLALSRLGENWQVADQSAERSILPPNAELRQPTRDELPAAEAWPARQCNPSSRRDGRKCSP
jgi:hypothetical protein